MRLGDLLVAQGLTSRADVETALARQGEEGGLLGSILVAMGVLSVKDLLSALRLQKQIETALHSCERTLKSWETAHGASHPSTNRARYNLARALVVAGRAEDAVALAEAAYRAHRTGLGQQHAWTRESGQLVADLRRTVVRLS